MPDSNLRVLVLPGSLRKASFNRALALALVDLAPDGAELQVFDLHDVPLYNGDLDNDELRPQGVRSLKARIEEADGLLLVSPEYNFGVPGVMKNALDWASRPAYRSPMAEKPTGIMGVSGGRSGTIRGQEQLKLNLLGMAAQVFPHPGVGVTHGGRKFEDGVLTDQRTRSFVQDYLAAYLAWVRMVSDPG